MTKPQSVEPQPFAFVQKFEAERNAGALRMSAANPREIVRSDLGAQCPRCGCFLKESQ